MTSPQPLTLLPTFIIERICQSWPGVQLIYLFGSRANGSAQENSDWDIAILASMSLKNVERWQLAQALAAQLGQDVDLVDLRQASTVLQMQVIDGGQLVFGEQRDASRFEMTVISMYGRLQESRQGIINDFKQRISGATHSE